MSPGSDFMLQTIGFSHRLLRSSESGANAAAYTIGPSTGPRPASSAPTVNQA